MHDTQHDTNLKMIDAHERVGRVVQPVARRRTRCTKHCAATATISALCLAVCALRLPVHSCFASQDFAPRITIQPNDLVAVEGESTELNCDAEGWPAPTFEWFHNGQLIKSSTHSRTTMGGSIQFLDIKPPRQFATTSTTTTSGLNSKQQAQSVTGDAGTYYCVATNALGQARSRNASLQVAYIRPELKVLPSERAANLGDTVELECLPEAWPAPSIKWRHNGQLIDASLDKDAAGAKFAINRIARVASSSGDKQSSDSASNMVDLLGSRLTVRKVDKSDEGAYVCVVETRASHKLLERESAPAQLHVGVRPHFIEAPESKQASAGSQVRLKCRIGGDPEPVVSWRKQNGQPLSEKTQIEPADKTLILDQVSAADSANYVCEGENLIGAVRATATLTVISQPRFHVQPEDQEVELGARVQLRCSGDASPTYLLYWYKEGHRQLLFPSSNAPMIANPAALVGAASGLTSSDWPQAAALVADNQYLGSSAPITSKMLNPALMSPASSDTSPATNKLFSIGPEQLAPNVYNNNYFGNRIYVDNRGTLNIVNVTSSDNGYYACALISPVGSVMTKAKVTVRGVVASNNQQYSPSDIYVDPTSMTTDALSGVYSASSVSKFDLLPPPIIRMGSVDQSLPINSSATIICDVLSRVNYEIKWSFNDRNVEPDGVRVIFFENGSLQINNLMTTDSGKYTCIATATDDPPQLASANPNEPIDASMLTAAPPTRRSTSHSAMLLVASPVQFNVPLHKMNIYEYPSAPGQAYAVTTLDSNNQDSITLAWAAPTDSGTLPITDYIVEHYDTAQEQDGWKVIYRIKGKEALQVDGLSSDGSHFFVIRALNSRGAGPSSPISEPLRTPAGEAKYLLELQRRGSRADIGGSHRPDANVARDKLMTLSTSLIDLVPMSSTSIRLRWATLIMANQTSMESTTNYPLLSAPDVKEFLEGYSIRYRAIGIGESVLDSAASQRPRKEAPNQFALPLVTSFLDETIESEHVARNKRDVLSSYIDYTQEFKEIRVVDHNTQYSTVKDLRPFTMYEFFVVPFFKEIDGVPSNILSAQTLEDRPAIGPPSLTIRPINDTAVRLMWLHVPPIYANGILRGYVVQLNRSDAYAADSDSQAISARAIDANPKFLNLPLGVLGVVPYGPPQQQQQQQTRATTYNFQQYIVMYDLTNLTYKSFYSAQVAALTSVGPGPWSEQQNFIMDPKLATQMRSTGNDFDDVMGRAFMANGPRSYAHESQANVYVVGSSIMIVFIIVVALGLALYRRNNQKVITWKKTISEHFTNKFYMPSTIEHAHHHHHREPNSMQQNIYDHQQHLIYSNSTTPAHLAHHHQQQQQQPHHLHQSIPSQTLWTNGNGCGVTTTSTGACLDRASSSLHGLLAINNDADANHQLVRRMNGADQQQQLLMNTAGANKDMTSRFANGVTSVAQCGTQMRQSDYYSVINNMAEYEELGQHQQRHINNNNNNSIQMQAASNYNQHHNHMPPSMADRHQTTSSNSDTSCPSSVTRLLPNQQSQHNKNVLDMHRQDMILHQQLVGAFQSDNNDANKQAFASLISSNPSPYATTNLIAHAPMTNNQLVMQHTSAGVTMDDSKIFGGQMMGAHNGQHVAVNQPFRTMQRGGGGGHFVVSSNQQPAQHQQQQIVVHHTARSHQAQHSTISNANQAVQIATNVTNNPLACAQDNRSASNNVYEHIDYNIDALAQRQRADMMISSSASSGSMLSSSQPNSPPEHNNNNGGSSASSSSHQANRKTGEAHDLRVFSKVRGSDAPELQRFVLNDDDNNARVNGAAGPDDADRLSQADETTAFRQQSLAGSDRRTRQLSKRKRQQQRTYMHNNSQPVG